MNTTLFLAQLFGVLFIAVGLGMLLNQKHYGSMIRSVLKSDATLYFGGAGSLTVGFLILSVHQGWGSISEVMITTIGYAALIKGILLIVFPGVFSDIAPSIVSKKLVPLYGAITLAIGVYLAYSGFSHLIG